MKKIYRVLVGCECYGRVRDAFKEFGWDAWSCDVKETRVQGNHIKGDVRKVLTDGWDLAIFHPPCTYLSRAGEGWMYHPKHPDRHIYREFAIKFFMELVNSPIKHWCIENPIGCMSREYRRVDQIICPTLFGHPEQKKTGLWLKNLPLLQTVQKVQPTPRIKFKSGKSLPPWLANSITLPKHKRQEYRSITFQGIADAMAGQWSWYVEGLK